VIVSLLMVSCSSTKISLTSKANEDWLVKCPAIAKDGKYTDFGEVWLKLNEVTDMYIDCAKRHNAWVEYERKKEK